MPYDPTSLHWVPTPNLAEHPCTLYELCYRDQWVHTHPTLIVPTLANLAEAEGLEPSTGVNQYGLASRCLTN